MAAKSEDAGAVTLELANQLELAVLVGAFEGKEQVPKRSDIVNPMGDRSPVLIC